MTDTRAALAHVGIELKDAEMWKPILGWPYEVSDQGRVRRADSPGHSSYKHRVLKARPDAQGYPRVTLRWDGLKKFVRVHRLVALVFLGSGAGCQVQHKNGVRADNRSLNLKFGDHRDNAEDARRHGTLALGARHGAAKLTAVKVRKIRILRKRGFSYRNIANKFNVSPRTIENVVSGHNWGHVK